MSKVLALDYGTVRIGVALSDETKKIAFVRAYIPAKRLDDLVMLIAEEEVEEIIMGLPKNLAGQETAAAVRAREFAEKLTEQSGLPVRFLDERFSTKEILRERPQREHIDSLVAQRMLQNYLDNGDHDV